MLKILVCGGIDFKDKHCVFETLSALDTLHFPHKFHVIHGDATGADSFANEWAESNGCTVVPCPADWDTHGPIHNKQMLKLKPDIVVAFPGGKGTEHMVKIAKEAGVAVIRITNKPNPVAPN